MAAQGCTLRGKEKKQGEPYNYSDFLPEPCAHANAGNGPQTKCRGLAERETQTLASGEAKAEKLHRESVRPRGSPGVSGCVQAGHV